LLLLLFTPPSFAFALLKAKAEVALELQAKLASPSVAFASPPFACASPLAFELRAKVAFERLRAKVLQAKAKVAFELQANAKRELKAKVELQAKVELKAKLPFNGS
jgi:hypothetical protein